MPIKELLNAFHDAVKWVLHVVLVPVIAVIKALIAGLTHIESELGKL